MVVFLASAKKKNLSSVLSVLLHSCRALIEASMETHIITSVWMLYLATFILICLFVMLLAYVKLGKKKGKTGRARMIEPCPKNPVQTTGFSEVSLPLPKRRFPIASRRATERMNTPSFKYGRSFLIDCGVAKPNTCDVNIDIDAKTKKHTHTKRKATYTV